MLRRVRQGFRSPPVSAPEHLSTPHLSLLSGPERAAVLRPLLISIPFWSYQPSSLNSEPVKLTIPECFVSIGPGSPILMLARHVTITLPYTPKQLMMCNGRFFAQDGPTQLGEFEAETITTGLPTWQKACYDAAVIKPSGRPGTMVQVESVARLLLFSLSDFVMIGVSHEVHSPHANGTVVSARGVRAYFSSAFNSEDNQ